MADKVCPVRDDGQESAIWRPATAEGVLSTHLQRSEHVMFWLIVVAVIVVGSLVLRRVLRGRRSPDFDQHALENANYSRITQDVRNADQRFGGLP